MNRTGTEELPSVHLGTPEEFEQLRAHLRSVHFDEHAICERLEIADMFRFRVLRDGRPTGTELRDALAVLIRLFLDVEPVTVKIAGSQLSRNLTDLLERFWLVERRNVDDVDVYVPRVWMYPLRDIIVASDLPADPVDPALPLRQDAVYPALTPDTRHLLSALPMSARGSLLELCAGTGVAALTAGAHAGDVCATDIAARAVHFAEFNARLNGRRVRNLCGDLYEPVAHQQFDCIVAHPPYIPTGAGGFVYRDGGEDGEQVVRRVIGGLEHHLRPGGSFYGLLMASDRRDASLEMRIRSFLGPGHAQFDVALGVIRTYSVSEMLGEFAADPWRSGEEIEGLRRRFETLEVEGFVYGVTVVRRRGGDDATPVTVRKVRGQSSESWPFDWLFAVERLRRSLGYRAELPSHRPRLSRHVAVEVRHGLVEGEWSPRRFRIVASLPFELETQCPEWVPALLARCDGLTTVTELFRGLVGDGLLPRESKLESFLDLIDRLIGWGSSTWTWFQLDRIPCQCDATHPVGATRVTFLRDMLKSLDARLIRAFYLSRVLTPTGVLHGSDSSQIGLLDRGGTRP